MVRSLAGAAALLLATPLGAEVAESSADHFVSRNSVAVKADPKATWLALIEPAGYWSKDHSWSGDAANLSITPQAGGCFCERLPEVDSAKSVGLAGSAQHMTVVMARPQEVLRMRGALGPLQSEPVDGVLTVTLQPDKASGGTKIVWEYVVAGHMRFEVAKISKAVDGVMAQQLGRLADKLGRVPSSGSSAPAAATAAPPRPSAASVTAPRPALSSPAAKPIEPVEAQDVGSAIDAMGKKPAPAPR